MKHEKEHEGKKSMKHREGHMKHSSGMTKKEHGFGAKLGKKEAKADGMKK